MSYNGPERRMAHGGEVLTACEKGWERFDKHVEESAVYRETSVKHTEQIITLERAHAQNMANICDIQKDIKEIRSDLGGIKIWVLSGVILGIVTVGGGILMFFNTYGSLNQKVDFIYQHSYGVQKAIGKKVEIEP